MNTAYYRHWFQTVLHAAPPHRQKELRRLKMAPFASDPATTYRPAPLYVVSMKPYGNGTDVYPFGWDERAEKPGFHRWYDGPNAGGNFVKEADRLLRQILKWMNVDMETRDVFNTYAYPFRAKDARQLKSFGLEAVTNLSLHKNFVRFLRPRLLLCLGNGPEPSAFALYRRVFDNLDFMTIDVAPRTKIKYFRTPETLVLGVPHLSYVRADTLLTEEIRRIVQA